MSSAKTMSLRVQDRADTPTSLAFFTKNSELDLQKASKEMLLWLYIQIQAVYMHKYTPTTFIFRQSLALQSRKSNSMNAALNVNYSIVTYEKTESRHSLNVEVVWLYIVILSIVFNKLVQRRGGLTVRKKIHNFPSSSFYSINIET